MSASTLELAEVRYLSSLEAVRRAADEMFRARSDVAEALGYHGAIAGEDLTHVTRQVTSRDGSEHLIVVVPFTVLRGDDTARITDRTQVAIGLLEHHDPTGDWRGDSETGWGWWDGDLSSIGQGLEVDVSETGAYVAASADDAPALVATLAAHIRASDKTLADHIAY